jgi:hypothetical protein
MFSLLLLLGWAVSVRNLAGRLFHGAVCEHLLPAQSFLLQRPESLFLLLCLLGHLVLPNLLRALVQNCLLLLCTEALEVVGLHAMRRQHRLLRCGILRHEVSGWSIGNLVETGFLSLSESSLIAVTLLTRQVVVRILVVHTHLLAERRMFFLRLLQESVVVSVQLVSFLLYLSLSLLSFVLLFDLLFDPVLLL